MLCDFILVANFGERTIARKHCSASQAWPTARDLANELFGAHGWQEKRDESVFGGRIVATDGRCLMVR